MRSVEQSLLRLLRTYDGIGLDTLSGQALFAGPSISSLRTAWCSPAAPQAAVRSTSSFSSNSRLGFKSISRPFDFRSRNLYIVCWQAGNERLPPRNRRPDTGFRGEIYPSHRSAGIRG